LRSTKGIQAKGFVELDNRLTNIYRRLVLDSYIFWYYYSSREPSLVADYVGIEGSALRYSKNNIIKVKDQKSFNYLIDK